MSELHVVGLKPWLPSILASSAWWTEPVRAERLAALRIAAGMALLLDILFTFWPQAPILFAPDKLGSTGGFPESRLLPYWPVSPLEGVASAADWHIVMGIWVGSALLMVLGIWPRIAAAVALFLSGAVFNVNPMVFNSGDNVRHTILFFLILTPCDAVWSLLPRRQPDQYPYPVFVWPWALRLLFVQMAVIYFVNGIAKLSPAWLSGDAIYRVMASLNWTRWSHDSFPVPFWMTLILTWGTLIWEIGFPLLVLIPATRKATLWIGVLFHIGTGAALKLAGFPLYMLCLYVPLLPWESWLDRRNGRPAVPPVSHAPDSAGSSSEKKVSEGVEDPWAAGTTMK
jgi:hypothetical protein